MTLAKSGTRFVVAGQEVRMRVVIPGGSGQVGTILARAMHGDGHAVVVLSRKPGAASSRNVPWETVPWDGRTLGEWCAVIDGADVVINLAGRSVNCRYGTKNRRLILDSRIESTRVIGAAIAACAHPPPVWLQAGTATIYEHRYDASNDESTGILGEDSTTSTPRNPETWRFSIDVAKAWEATLDEAPAPHTRKVSLRAAMTMSPDAGGVFDVLMTLVRRRLGGRVGDGRQFMSWIHETDFVAAVYWLIDHAELRGAVNLSAPNPLPQEEFMAALRLAAGVRLGLPATRWMLEVATFFMRTESELILKSRRVVPRRLLDSGFEFTFPTWPEAAADLAARWRREDS